MHNYVFREICPFIISISLSLSLSLSLEFKFYSKHFFLIRKEKLIFHTWYTRFNIWFATITEIFRIGAFFHFMFSNCLPKIDTLNRVTFTNDLFFLNHLWSIHLSLCKLFTLSSSHEPLGQFLPHSVQSFIGWREFKFDQIKGPAFFQGEIIAKYWKYIDEILKIFLKTT